MDTRLRAVYTRRSVRDYTKDPIGESELHELLEAAMAAPSANNRQPWQFVVVRERRTLDKLAEVHPYAKMLAKAPLAIAVCGDPGVSDWWVQDCSAATENLLIAAAGLGLGGVWIGCHGRTEREEAIRQALKIPQSIGVLSLISLGHPAESAEERTRYEGQRIHLETW
jgi:nitroreductase